MATEKSFTNYYDQPYKNFWNDILGNSINILTQTFFPEESKFLICISFIFIGIQKYLLPDDNIWEFPNQFAPNLWNSEDQIITEQLSSVTVNSMEQVTVQEWSIPFQQNIVVIYKVEEFYWKSYLLWLGICLLGNVSIEWKTAAEIFFWVCQHL